MEISSQEMERMNDNPLYNTIGIQVYEVKDGHARSRLRPNKDVCWPFSQPHGGILATLMDTTMAWAVLTRIDQGYNCVTINLDIQYTNTPKGESFICLARTTHRANRIVYTRADILDEKEKLLATAQGVFRIIKAPLM
ncbi:PaaI family thioesterase [Thermodesulfobacteriota bacterium]